MDAADPMSSPQFRLLVACSNWPRGPNRDQAVREATAIAGLDWPAFLAMVRRHRMASVALDGLASAGIAPPSQLKVAAKQDACRAMGLFAEAARLQAQFAAEGIAMAVVKGPVLSQLLYGTPGLRQAKDLDIWVAPADVYPAVGVLQARGYEVIEGPPAFAAPWLDLWLDTHKDSEFRHPLTGFVVELHHRLTENPHAMAQLKATSATREVSIGGTALQTLRDDDLFTYLCTHGAVSRWFRLKWLADIQAMLSVRSPAEIARLFDVARTGGLKGPRVWRFNSAAVCGACPCPLTWRRAWTRIGGWRGLSAAASALSKVRNSRTGDSAPSRPNSSSGGSRTHGPIARVLCESVSLTGS